MKRAIWTDLKRRGRGLVGGATLAALAACSAPDRQPAEALAGASAWVMTPTVQRADRTNDGLILRGMTGPSGRVVVRAAGGVAYATGADDQGRFVLRIAPVASDTLFVVETQNGQEAAPAPYRLLITRDPAGPIALLTPGGPSHRLDMTGPLDVIDSDGRATIASGRAIPGADIQVALDGETARDLKAGPDGRWVASMDGSAITVGGRSYVRPVGATAGEGAMRVISVTGGRLVVWSTSAKTAQSSWFPDRS